MKGYNIDLNLKESPIDIVKTTNHNKMEENILEVYPSIPKHKFFGFGGALTQASGYILSKMCDSDAVDVLSSYYSPFKANYRYVRVPIDSCDFSTEQYEACSSMEQYRNGVFDFSMDEAYIMPYLDVINEISKKSVPILFSPWSPAAYFKDNGSRLLGGYLKKEHYNDWAEYIARYLSEYRNRGYNVWALTIQNEPNAVQTWDSCLYAADEERDFLLTSLKPVLDAFGLSDVEVYYWDHNKERLITRTNKFLTGSSSSVVKGLAFHGYCGDHFESLERYRLLYPDQRLILSEFCMGFDDRKNYKKQLAVYGHEYINDIAFGADTIIDWNLILDANGGPNHVGNWCMAPFMVDEHYRHRYNMAFKVISVLSKAAGIGSDVLFSTSYDKRLDMVSFMRVDKGISIVIGSSDKDQLINLRIGETVFSFILKKDTLTAINLKEKDYE